MIDYRRVRLSDSVFVLIFKKSDLTGDKKTREQIETLLTGSERTIIHGNTFIQRNGYGDLVKEVKFNKKEEKMFIIAEKPILKGYERTLDKDGVEYHF